MYGINPWQLTPGQRMVMHLLRERARAQKILMVRDLSGADESDIYQLFYTAFGDMELASRVASEVSSWRAAQEAAMESKHARPPDLPVNLAPGGK